ncbi:MAG: hypothetical protein PVI09_12480, partial [Anaerolineae bacterium]
MKHHFFLQRRFLTAGTSFLLLGLLVASLAGAVSPSVPPAGDGSPAGGVPAWSVAQAEGGRPSAQTGPAAARRAVREAWEKARDAGTYAFATHLAQTTFPALALVNAGRGPERSELLLQGEIDQPARTMAFRMGQPGSEGSAEGRIEGDRAYLRQSGGEWREVEDFSGSFAPDNDLLAFLGGIKDVAGCDWQAADPEHASTTPAQIACYGFNLDGPALASYLRQQVERQLAERGELPLGVTLEAPAAFRDMTGQGELWVDGRGLPLRLSMHLVFPKQDDGSRLEAEVQTDFSGFPQGAAALPDVSEDPAAWAGATLGLDDPSLPDKAARTAGSGGVLVLTLAATGFLFVHHRSRRMYIAVVLAVILSMTLVPLLQSERVVAFYDRQAARAQHLWSLGADGQAVDPEVAEQPAAAQQAVAEALAPSWDPQQDPLAKPVQTVAKVAGDGLALGVTTGQPLLGPVAAPEPSLETPVADRALPSLTGITETLTDTTEHCRSLGTEDPDGDGVNDTDECLYGLDPGEDDTDGDGLTDGQELHKLGTDGSSLDTDGDLITDAIEVKGFGYAERQWYLNPKNPDTNNDGVTDSVECPVLLDVVDPDEEAIGEGCDSDGDGVPNPFDTDNDGDGVPDRVDLAPNQWVDAVGPRSGQVTNRTPFDGDNPFKLTVENLQSEWPVLVDLQMRPVNPAHLGYAMNVLDWPAGDIDGQIQHKANTTFATSNNVDVRNPDDIAGRNGDMRLVPLLEIVMTGPKIPLKLTDPVMTAAVGTDTPLSTTVTLEPGDTNSDTQFTFTYHAGASLKVYEGPCSALLGDPLGTFTGTGGTLLGHSVVELADGDHALVVSNDTVQKCAEIPDVVNGPYANKMVDLSVLEPYGITAHDREAGGDPAVVVLVPLNVATDDTGGGKSAFQSRMIYWVDADSDWQEPQQMRLIWLVQMLTDACAPGAKEYEEFYDEYKAAHDEAEDPEVSDAYNRYYDKYCAEHRTADEIIPVQKYDEQWTLAGLSVREDHGLDVAVAYVNPDLTQYDDDALWTLSWGLGQRFMTQMDCEGDGTSWDGEAETCDPDQKRDLAIFLQAPKTDHSVQTTGNTTIKQRFDVTTTVPITARWNIEAEVDQPFPLRVENFRYDSQDYLSYHAKAETPRILAQYSHTVTPTLLFAREERYRMAGLEALTGTDSAGIAIDLGTGTDAYPQETLVGLVWAPFRTNPNTDEWEAYPPTEYWDALGNELKKEFYQHYKDDSPEANLGRVVVARAYQFALMNGVVNGVQCTPDQPLCQVPNPTGASDGGITKAGKDLLNGLNVATILTWKDIFGRRDAVQPGAAQNPWFDDIGWAIKNHASNWETVFTESPFAIRLTGGIVVTAACVTIIATIVVAYSSSIDGAQAAALVIRDASLLIATHCLIHTLATQWKAFSASG